MLFNSLLTSMQPRFHGTFQDCSTLKQYKSIGNPPFVGNFYLMASALDPVIAYHWVDIDVEIEHHRAQTSHAQQNTKSTIED